jgi:hypothetical protein
MSNGVLSFVFERDGATIMQAFNPELQMIAELVENGNDWTLFIEDKEFNVEGRGCKDPIEFIERLVSPPRLARPTDPWLLRFVHANGESWEVWAGE